MKISITTDPNLRTIFPTKERAKAAAVFLNNEHKRVYGISRLLNDLWAVHRMGSNDKYIRIEGGVS